MTPEDETDRLYGLPLEDFVAERDALAKALRADGRKDAANAVKALPKPSIAAWGANQAVRARPKEARALWSAGDELRGAQTALLAGSGDAGALRKAQEREQAALGPLVEAARGLLTGGGRGLGEDVLERVGATLHAAALDPDQRQDAAAGRLARELAYAGFGLGEDAMPAAPPARSRARRRTPTAAPSPARARGGADATPVRTSAPRRQKGDERAAARDRAARERAEREAAERRERVTVARRTVREAEAAHARAELELTQAERGAARAAQRLDAAREADAEARRAAQEAAREERRRDRALAKAREALEDLEG